MACLSYLPRMDRRVGESISSSKDSASNLNIYQVPIHMQSAKLDAVL